MTCYGRVCVLTNNLNKSAGVQHWMSGVVLRSCRNGSSLNTADESFSDGVKSFEDIPGPGGPPWFGTYFKYKTGSIRIETFFDTLREWQQQYGDIVKETLLGHTVVHVFNPDAIRTVYANEDKWPNIEPLAETTQLYREASGMSPGLGNSNGEEWYRLRSAVQQLMMRPKEVLPFLAGTDPVALDFIHLIKTRRSGCNQVPDFDLELSRWSLESSGVHCFSSRLGYLTDGRAREEAEVVVAANQEVFSLTAHLHTCLPFYKRFATPRQKRLFQAADYEMRVLKKHLNEALASLKEKSEEGILGDGDFLFLRYMLSREELSQRDVATLTLSLFIDGLSTTVQQLLFALYLLATNPAVQERAYQEVAHCAPPFPSPLTPDCIAKMAYMRACIKESLRMLPMTNEISRVTKKDMVLGGYHIPAETSVHLDNQVLYRSPQFFFEPDSFMPERWLRKDSAEKIHPFIVLPFGHGPRMCAGRRFAEQDMAVILTRILQNFRLEWHHPPMGLKYMTLNVPDCPAAYTFLDR